jgi:hypothetical protein
MTAAFVAPHLGDPITATARRYPSERVANVLRGALHPFLRFIKSLQTLIWAALLSLIVWSGESTLFGLFLAALGTLLPSTPRYVGAFQGVGILALGVVAHAIQFAPNTLLAVIFISSAGLGPLEF